MPLTGAEIVGKAHELFNARDVEGLVGITHPDCVWLPFRAQLEGSAYREHDGVRRFLRDMDEDWSAFRIDPIEMTEHGNSVLSIGRVRGTGRGSGVDIDFVAGFVFELEDGLVKRLMSYNDPDDARRAV
jgi:ketosteroid isomerase-like protein